MRFYIWENELELGQEDFWTLCFISETFCSFAYVKKIQSPFQMISLKNVPPSLVHFCKMLNPFSFDLVFFFCHFIPVYKFCLYTLVLFPIRFLNFWCFGIYKTYAWKSWFILEETFAEIFPDRWRSHLLWNVVYRIARLY